VLQIPTSGWGGVVAGVGWESDGAGRVEDRGFVEGGWRVDAEGG
jgi:hypothetical protein